MKFKVYSFEDVTCSFSHPAKGSKSSTGAGIGSITTSMTGDKTTHETSADGRIFVLRVPGDNGTITVTMQQTSDLHKWLLKWYNYINGPDSDNSDWIAMNITIKNNYLREQINCTGVSPQKRPDKPYQAQGQMITWSLMAMEITEESY